MSCQYPEPDKNTACGYRHQRDIFTIHAECRECGEFWSFPNPGARGTFITAHRRLTGHFVRTDIETLDRKAN